MVKFHQIEMVRDRGFIIPQEELDIYDQFDDTAEYGSEHVQDYIKNFSQLIEESGKTPEKFMNAEYRHNIHENKLLLVFYVEYVRHSTKNGEKIVDNIKDILSIVSKRFSSQDLSDFRLILISPIPPSKQISTYEIKFPSYNIQYFSHAELMFNITKHVLVPTHTLLNPPQKELLSQNVKLANLHTININDPVVKYYGANVGDIFSILREDFAIDTISKQSLIYRRVAVISSSSPGK